MLFLQIRVGLLFFAVMGDMFAKLSFCFRFEFGFLPSKYI